MEERNVKIGLRKPEDDYRNARRPVVGALGDRRRQDTGRVSPAPPMSRSAEDAFQEGFEPVHIGLAGQQRVAAIGRPFNHRAIIEPDILAPQNL